MNCVKNEILTSRGLALAEPIILQKYNTALQGITGAGDAVRSA